MNKKYGSDINQNQITIKENINQGNIQQENFTNSSFAPVNQYQMPIESYLSEKLP